MNQLVIDPTNVQVSNIVGLFDLDNELYMNAVFRLCTLEKIGDIKCISYQEFKRGIPPKKKKKVKDSVSSKGCWKNGLCINMYSNISVKLSDKTLHITGCKSHEQAHDCFKDLRENFSEVESNIKYINENIEIAKQCVNWITENIKGDEIYVVKNSQIVVDPTDVVIYGPKIYLNIASKLYKNLELAKHLIPLGSCIEKFVYERDNKIIDYPLIELEKFITIKDVKREDAISKGCDERIYDFYIDKRKDFTRYDEYILNLDWFLKIDSLYKRGHELTQIDFGYGNNNYNYNLGFLVNLKSLNGIFSDTHDFICEYQNEISKFATVTFQIEIPPHLLPQIRKKEKAKLPKFIIYNTGSITQSAPHPELADISRKRFIEIINQNINKIKFC